MRKDAVKHPDVDGLLKQVFADDLPVDAEAALAAQFDRFRETWGKTETAREARASRLRRLSFSPARIALVAASICFIAFGFSLRLRRTPTPLASSLATLQTAASVSGQVGSGRIMGCTVHLDTEGGDTLRYVIRWVSPEETQVRIILAGEESVRTVFSQSGDRSVLELVSRAAERETREELPLDAELLPVEDLLTSSRLRRLLAGRWLPAGIERTNGCDRESFSIARTIEELPSKVTVDACTFLPMKLERKLDKGGKLEAVFLWIPQSQPGLDFRRIPL